MTAPQLNTSIQAAAISDRGLSDKRPVNEDSFLADATRGIFAVADGVGGAQSGEVASQTAIETLDEAFRHHKRGDDAEDLMEISFQRANLAIHQMSRQQHRLAMMATTVVALHLEANHATLGHVGDSRLYRLTPEGTFRRETVDHSVVEEEVRAGRMTAAEAQHHPSRNVISRALGAERNVEADMHTLDVKPNTLFLLCSDGITRHIPDDELRELLLAETNLHRACDELKRRCYERGAEDNLTAVLVRVGGEDDGGSTARSLATTPLNSQHFDSERTIAHTRRAAYDTGELPQAFTQFSAAPPPELDIPPVTFNYDSSSNHTPAAAAAATTTPLSHVAPTAALSASRFEVSTEPPPQDAASNAVDSATTSNVSRASRSATKILVALASIVVISAALTLGYYGRSYLDPRPEPIPVVSSAAVTLPQDSQSQQTPSVAPTPMLTYIEQREAVDEAPQLMMQQMWRDRQGEPLSDTDPKFLYLYGRSLLNAGFDRDAQQAFLRAVEMVRERLARGEWTTRAGLIEVETHLSTRDPTRLTRASEMLDEMMRQEQTAASSAAQPLVESEATNQP